jgi:hypothetical protein
LLARRDSSKEEATMAASNLLRWAGLAALVGSVLIVLAEMVGLLGGVYAGTSSRGLSIFVASLFLLSAWRWCCWVW